jgi:metal-responsive CopG/Arc/MetJ family transcriptional regulator
MTTKTSERRVTVTIPTDLAEEVDHIIEEMTMADWSSLVAFLLDRFVSRRKQTREAAATPGRTVWVGKNRMPSVKVIEGGRGERQK